MTVNIDTRLFPELSVDSKLMALLQEMSHFNAAFSYEAIDASGYSEAKRIRAVAVFVDSQPVGKVSVSTRSNPGGSGAQETVYHVTSDNVRKSRGQRHTKETKHMKLAMRVVREAFQRAEASVIADRLIKDAQSKIGNITMWARDHARGVLLKACDPVLSYLQTVDNGTATTSAGLPPTLAQAMGSKWQDYLRDHRIATAVSSKFEAKYGVVVRTLRDETMQVVNLKEESLTIAKSSYDLPAHYQEKLTILKIMDDGQPVEHVGFKFKDYEHINGVRDEYQAFFLIDGPTYTSCD